MSAEQTEKEIDYVTIPVIATGKIRLLCDKFVRALLVRDGNVLDEALPGELITNRFFSKNIIAFNNGDYFEPAQGTNVIIYYYKDDFSYGKYPSMTIMQG